MDVNCPRCDTLFEFDERQMRGAIATLKCSVCQHLFRIETNIALGREDHRRWMVRNVTSGDVLYFSGFDQLHRWIMEGQITRADEISRTGQKWVKLEHVGEFSPVFEVVESIQHLTRAQDDARVRSGTIQQFPAIQPTFARDRQGSAPTLRSPSRQPAPSWAGAQPERATDAPSGRLELSPLQVADAAPSFSPSLRLPPSPHQGRPFDIPDDEESPQLATLELSRPVHEPRSPQGRPVTPSAQEWSIDSASAPAPPPEDRSQEVLYRVDEPTTTSSRLTATTKKTGGLLKALLVLVVLLFAGVGVLAIASPATFASLTGMQLTSVPANDPAANASSEVAVDPAVEKAQQDRTIDEALAAMAQPLDAAITAALDARDAAHASYTASGVIAAMSPLHGAFDEAKQSASRAGSPRATASSALKDARRALDSGDTKKAYDLYYKVLDREARNAQALTGLGWTLLQMGRHESAAVQFRRAMAIEPSSTSAYLGLAKAERNRGNAKGAILIYEQFLKKFPSSREANIARTQREKLLKEVGQ